MEDLKMTEYIRKQMVKKLEKEDNDWNNIDIFDDIEEELQKRRVTYYPLNKDE
jgi:hypothetical protein